MDQHHRCRTRSDHIWIGSIYHGEKTRCTFIIYSIHSEMCWTQSRIPRRANGCGAIDSVSSSFSILSAGIFECANICTLSHRHHNHRCRCMFSLSLLFVLCPTPSMSLHSLLCSHIKRRNQLCINWTTKRDLTSHFNLISVVSYISFSSFYWTWCRFLHVLCILTHLL